MIQGWPLVLRLGSAQTLAWASTYYLPAIIAPAMAQDLGLPVSRIWLAFSLALVVSALLGPLAGRNIDRWGGRPVLILSSGLFAAGLLGLSAARGSTGLVLAWLLLGVAMGGGLYEAAFAALVRLQGLGARASITGITLVAGFASTVGWPLSSLLQAEFGWRGTCIAWAVLHLLVGLPLNAGLPRAEQVGAPLPAATPNGTAPAPSTSTAPAQPHRWTAPLLSFVFAVAWFNSTAMAAHLPRLLMASGLTLAAAVGVAALVGPAQVAGRLLEFGVLRRWHPLLSARLATVTHPLGVLVLVVVGPAAAPVFALLHGAGNGILTIAKGTLPLLFYGPQGYGLRQGLIMAPGRFLQAFAPLVFGAGLERWGNGAFWITGTLAAGAWLALMALHAPGHRPGS